MTRRKWCRGSRQAVRVPVVWVVLAALTVTCGGTFADELAEKEVKTLGEVPGFGATEVAVSSDGQRLAYVAMRDEGQVVVCDGKDGPACDLVTGLTFSGNGRVLAYAACKGNQWCVVAGGKAGPAHTTVVGLGVSYNGKCVAYYVPDEGNTGTVYINGERRKGARAVASPAPVVSRTGVVAFAGRASGTFEMANPLSAKGGTRSGNWGYTDMLDRRIYMMCGRSRSRLYHDLRTPVFSPNGATLAYAARLDTGWFILCGKDKLGGPFEDVSAPVWSRDSRKVAFAARKGAEWHVVGGAKTEGPYDTVGVMAFSPRTRLLACAVQKGGQWLLVCDGRKGPECDDVHWIGFSENDRHLACAVESGGQWRMVVDGVEGPAHDRIHVPEEASQRDGLRYVAVDDGKACLMELAWPADKDWQKGFE